MEGEKPGPGEGGDPGGKEKQSLSDPQKQVRYPAADPSGRLCDPCTVYPGKRRKVPSGLLGQRAGNCSGLEGQGREEYGGACHRSAGCTDQEKDGSAHIFRYQGERSCWKKIRKFPEQQTEDPGPGPVLHGREKKRSLQKGSWQPIRNL